jgi:hypothetical protein
MCRMLEQVSEPKKVQLRGDPWAERDPDVVAWERIGFAQDDAAPEAGKRERAHRPCRAAPYDQDFGGVGSGHLG